MAKKRNRDTFSTTRGRSYLLNSYPPSKSVPNNTPTPPEGDWILRTGFWDDNGFWRDTSVWID